VGICEQGVVTGSLVDTGYDVTLCVIFRLAVLRSAQVSNRAFSSEPANWHTAQKSEEDLPHSVLRNELS
jgi:hypothetical protein